MSSSIRLTKHHAVGNDFLVLLDFMNTHGVGAEQARAWCNRRTGVGADGLIIVTSPDSGTGADGDVEMILYNADGSVAEISGNGIRCLGQAVALDRGLSEFELKVSTGSGTRTLQIKPDDADHTMLVSVDMGRAVSQGDEAELDLLDSRHTKSRHIKSLTVSMGNPHSVFLFDDENNRDLIADSLKAGDSNVELVLAGSRPDTIAMRVIERGVGETLACGSGACAAAYAAHEWGLVGTHVIVEMPGGDVSVDLVSREIGIDAIVLTGPTKFVATVEIPWP